ncbi:MAG: uncharacterized protein K0S08_1054 [Gammaproteobacteria bacterium]|jgi:hypothetical protein|nr:uncharacterized protein [Gammaproteobacteria bacterium]
MNTLQDIQEALQNYIQGKPSSIEEMIIGKNAKEVKRRLSIYQEAYSLRLAENLQKQYPMLAKALGYDKFQALCKDYQTAYPPTDRIIRRYGAALVPYLKSVPYEQYLIELAEFEWAKAIALDDSAEANLLTLEDLQKLSPEAFTKMRFKFHPSLQFFAFDYDIPNYWMALDKSTHKKLLPDKAKAPYFYANWRKNYIPFHLALTTLTFQLAQAVKNNASFADLCEIAAKDLAEEAASQTVAQTILQWIQHGWLSK